MRPCSKLTSTSILTGCSKHDPFLRIVVHVHVVISFNQSHRIKTDLLRNCAFLGIFSILRLLVTAGVVVGFHHGQSSIDVRHGLHAIQMLLDVPGVSGLVYISRPLSQPFSCLKLGQTASFVVKVSLW